MLLEEIISSGLECWLSGYSSYCYNVNYVQAPELMNPSTHVNKADTLHTPVTSLQAGWEHEDCWGLLASSPSKKNEPQVQGRDPTSKNEAEKEEPWHSTLSCTHAQAHSLANTHAHTLHSQRKFLEEIMFSLIKITKFISQKADIKG